MDFAGAYTKKDAGRFVNRNSNEHCRESLPTYLRLHENTGKSIERHNNDVFSLQIAKGLNCWKCRHTHSDE